MRPSCLRLAGGSHRGGRKTVAAVLHSHFWDREWDGAILSHGAAFFHRTSRSYFLGVWVPIALTVVGVASLAYISTRPAQTLAGIIAGVAVATAAVLHVTVYWLGGMDDSYLLEPVPWEHTDLVGLWIPAGLLILAIVLLLVAVRRAKVPKALRAEGKKKR